MQTLRLCAEGHVPPGRGPLRLLPPKRAPEAEPMQPAHAEKAARAPAVPVTVP